MVRFKDDMVNSRLEWTISPRKFNYGRQSNIMEQTPVQKYRFNSSPLMVLGLPREIQSNKSNKDITKQNHSSKVLNFSTDIDHGLVGLKPRTGIINLIIELKSLNEIPVVN